MKFDLTKPCQKCPFRNDIPGYLGDLRAEDICESIVDRQQGFPCHETVVTDMDDDGVIVTETTEDSRHCAGALIFLEKQKISTQITRLATKMGRYDSQQLDMTASVCENGEEFIEHHDVD